MCSLNVLVSALLLGQALEASSLVAGQRRVVPAKPTAWRNVIAHLAHDVEVSNSTALANSSEQLPGPFHPKEQMLTESLRMTITEFQKGMHHFHLVDRDRNDQLSTVEFDSGLDPETAKVGKEVFLYFAPDGTMTHQQYFRFVALVIVQPGEIAWQKGERAALTEYNEQSKSELLKLFIVFDENSDGGITKTELKDTEQGKLLPKLREQQIPIATAMSFELEYQFAKEDFDRFAGEDKKLGFLEFVGLLKHVERRINSGVSRNEPFMWGLALLTSLFLSM